MKETKRIRFVDSAATHTTQYVRGQSYDLEPTFADAMVKCGAAVSEEPAPVPMKRGKHEVRNDDAAR
jgi:hypothetical protein